MICIVKAIDTATFWPTETLSSKTITVEF